MHSTFQSNILKAAIFFSALLIFEVAVPARVWGGTILLGRRHGACAVPVRISCDVAAPPISVVEERLQAPADDVLLEEDESSILPVDFDIEKLRRGESAAFPGAIDGIRPTGFLPSFLEPTRSFAFGSTAFPYGFPPGFGGDSGGGTGEGRIRSGAAGEMFGDLFGSPGRGTFGTSSNVGGTFPGGSSVGDPANGSSWRGTGGDSGGDPGGGSVDPGGSGSWAGGSELPGATTPEPSTLILGGIGIVGLMTMAWRRFALLG